VRRVGLSGAALGICLAAVLTGCAAFETCGLGGCPGDARISAEVRGLLAQSPELGAPNQISVQTSQGVVYLRGIVSTPYQIAEAGSIARRAAGAKGVENLLSLDNSR
jgi:osmotically-inducible protein OsmY